MKLNERFEACELLTTGWCPLDCEYCYIPKTDAMKELHERITKQIESGEIIDQLSSTYDDSLTSLSFWGTEPLLILPEIESKLDRLLDNFPELEKFQFSTSLMLKSDIILSFIKKLRDSDRKLELEIQISIDGPEFITNKNRKEGAVKKIKSHLFELLDNLSKEEISNLEIIFKWKPTLTINNMREMLDDPSKIDQYREFFLELNNEFKERNEKEKISLHENSWNWTIVVPGKYTSDDGRIFARFLRETHKRDIGNTYVPRLKKLINYQDELGVKKRMFTCSAGDSNTGLGKEFHLCHRSFYFNDKKYIQSVMKQERYENWDVSHLEDESIEMFRDKWIIDPEDEKEMARWQYVLRNYHDFWKFQIEYILAMMQQLGKVDQVDERYLEDEDLRVSFAIFNTGALGCPVENLLNTGSIHLTPVSLLRMFGNGAFQEIVRQYYELPERER